MKYFFLPLFLLLGACSSPQPTHPKLHKVVFVHGIFDNGKNMGTLERQLKRAEYHVIAPSLKPNNGTVSITQLSHQLGQTIDQEIKEGEPFHLIAFSMGGIIARDYLSKSKRWNDCKSLTTLASPHNGTYLAHLYPVAAGREMKRGSSFLQRLNANPKSIPKHTLSVRTPLDLVILPSSSSELQGASNRTVFSLAHPMLLFNPFVKQMILEHLKTAEINH